MSQWTHVAGTIRVDGLSGASGDVPRAEEMLLLKSILGPTFSYCDSVEKFEKCKAEGLPIGSESSIQYRINIYGEEGSMDRGTIVIWGDLRDYDNVDEIRMWFFKSLAALQFDVSTFDVREAVLVIDVEFSGKKIVLLYDEGEYVKKEGEIRFKVLERIIPANGGEASVKYVCEHADGRGAIYMYRDGSCERTLLSGIRPLSLADSVTAMLNCAYVEGLKE